MILLRGIYHKNNTASESLAGFMIFGNGLFFVTALLHSVDISMGFAFGLFAVFSMLRYRTESLNVTDMTYLFVLITISLLSSVSSLTMAELAIVNLTICGLTAFFESSFFSQKISCKTIIYENIKLINSTQKAALIADLNNRLGIDVIEVEIGDVDFLRDSAALKIFYHTPKNL